MSAAVTTLDASVDGNGCVGDAQRLIYALAQASRASPGWIFMQKTHKWALFGIAAAGTLLAHLFFFFVLVLWAIFATATQIIQEQDPEQLTITMVDSESQKPEPAPEPTPTPPPPPPPKMSPTEFIRTTAEQASEPPVNAVRESERDTRAATEDRAYEEGLADLASVRAKKQDWMELDDQKFGPDPGKETPPAPPKAAPQPTATPEPPKPTPSIQPTPPPEPTQRPPTPLPTQKPLPTPKPEALALLKKEAVPTPPPKPTPQTARLSSNPPSKAGGNPSDKVASEVMGKVSRQGKTSLDSVATPMGKYKAQVAAIVEERWQFFVRGKIDFVTVGSLRVRFLINTSGKVQNLQLLENSSNEAFASFTYKAITDANLPPIPVELHPLLDRGRLEMEYNFILVAQ